MTGNLGARRPQGSTRGAAEHPVRHNAPGRVGRATAATGTGTIVPPPGAEESPDSTEQGGC